MNKLLPWTKLPSAWIEKDGLRQFQWGQQGADNAAALMTLAVIAHHAEPETGTARLTYGELSEMASLSRAKVSASLSLLAARNLIERAPDGRSSYRLCDYDPASGWAQFPAKGLYHNGVVSAFAEFRLRRPAELEALKLYYLFAARRSRDINMALISYDKIESYTGVARNNIRRALTVLGANDLIHTERFQSQANDHAIMHGYRLTHLNTRNHMGTTGRNGQLLSLPRPDWM